MFPHFDYRLYVDVFGTIVEVVGEGWQPAYAFGKRREWGLGGIDEDAAWADDVEDIVRNSAVEKRHQDAKIRISPSRLPPGYRMMKCSTMFLRQRIRLPHHQIRDSVYRPSLPS